MLVWPVVGLTPIVHPDLHLFAIGILSLLVSMILALLPSGRR